MAIASKISKAARRAAEPTAAQSRAGNYRMGHVRIHGLDITIETPRGRARRPEWPPMAAHYGYLKRTAGADGDHLDVLVGPHPDSELVVIVDQPTQSGECDEHKCLLGFRTRAAAVDAYRSCYTPGWRVGPVTAMTIQQFKAWLRYGSQRKPVASQVSRYSATETATMNRESFAISFADAVCEQYAARNAKNSPGQLGLFGDGLGGDAPLRTGKRQGSLNWDETKHPRATDGRFGTVAGDHGTHSGATAGATKKPGQSQKKTPERIVLGKRAGDAKVLGAMLYEQLQNKKPVSLLGQTARTAEEMAQLAQVYRDPRFETLRAFFVKDGVIVGQNAYSSRHPAAVALPENMLEQIDEDLKSLGADGFYLLHNHPSGAPDPSPEDIAVTKRIEEVLPGKLLDHVIIDHTQGSIIDKTGKVRYYKADNEQLQDVSKATVPHEYLGKKILSTIALGQMAMGLRPEKGRAVMIFTNVKGAVQMLIDVNPDSLISERGYKVIAAIRRAARATNSDRRFLVLPEGSKPKDYEHLTRIGAVTDIAAGGAKTAMEDGATGNPDPIQRRIKGREIARERFAAFDQEAYVDRLTATLHGMTPEQYAAHKAKHSPGQMGLFGDGFGGHLLRSTHKQLSLNWDESKHPRASDGRFGTTAGVHTGPQPKPPKPAKAKKPFVYPNGETQTFGGDDKPATPAPQSPKPEPPKPEATKPKPPKTEQVGSDDATPRERAKQATDDDQGDYEFARKSAVPNAGEDLKGSARHKVNAWRSLEEAEKDGTAEQMATRDQLLKNEPHSLAALAHRDPVTALAMHLALKAFPAKPSAGAKYYKPTPEEAKKDRQQYVDAYKKIKEAAENQAKKAAANPMESLVALRDSVKNEILRLRKDDNYNRTANALVELHNKLGQPWKKTSVIRQLGEFMELDKKHHAEMSPDNRRESVVDKVMRILEGKTMAAAFGQQGGGGKKTTFNAAAMYVAHARRSGGPKMPASTAKDATQYMVEKVGLRGVQFGNSVSDDERQHHATMAATALLDLADVTGLPLDAVSLGGKLGLAIGARGKGMALAHYEPGTQVINLTRKNGVGSLAHEWGHALDHAMQEFSISTVEGKSSGNYQSEKVSPKELAYNTPGDRSSGIKVENGKAVYNDVSGDPVWSAMDSLRKAWRESGFEKRLGETISDMVRSGQLAKNGPQGRNYWASGREKLARCFERFVQRKLEKSGRENTYLAGVAKHPLWPTDDEVDHMAPHFEKLLDTWRKEKHGLEKPVKYSADERQAYIDRLTATMAGRPVGQCVSHRFAAAFTDAVVERYRMGGKAPARKTAPAKEADKATTTVGSFGDRGRFVTIEGHPVFIKDDGEIGNGPKHLKGRNARDFKDVTERKRGPRTERFDKFIPRTRQDHAIVEAIGDHPDDVAAFRGHVEDAHKFLTHQTTEINDAMRDLLAQFGYVGRQASGFLSSLQRQRDTARIRNWDQMAEYAAAHHPELLAGSTGESTGKGDIEHALFARLRQGFQPPPSRHDPQVMELALKMAGPSFMDAGGPEIDAGDDDGYIGGKVLANPNDPFSDYVPFAATLGHAFMSNMRTPMLPVNCAKTVASP